MAAGADRVRDRFVVALASVGGALDALAYLHLHVFVANMTGNTVLLGLGLGGGRLDDALRAAAAIVAFFAGVFVGARIGRRASDQDRWPAAVSRTLAVEALMLAAFAGEWPARPYVLLALGACAMGLQSAATRDLDGGSVSSTFMTGTLMRLAFAFGQKVRGADEPGGPLNTAIWTVYLVAAFVVGAIALHEPGLLRALAGLCAAAIAFVALAARPIVAGAARDA